MRRYLFRPEVLVLLLAISLFGAKKLWVDDSTYKVGNTGPGGGIVFYKATTPFACGPTLESMCTYLESAPAGWSVTQASGCQDFAGSSTEDPFCRWSEISDSIGTDTAIGTGYKNTLAIIAAYSSQAEAASASQAYLGGGLEDWYLPSADELNELYLRQTTVGGFATANCWSSSEGDADDAWFQYFNYGGQGNYGKSHTAYVRPVRAF